MFFFHQPWNISNYFYAGYLLVRYLEIGLTELDESNS